MKLTAIGAAALFLAGPAAALGQTYFFDDFNNGPSPLWENQRGGWLAQGGVYFATIPDNTPPTYSSLPYVLADLDLELDVVAVNDGGVWLHADAEGQNGVLLVTGGQSHTGTGFYWHEVVNGGYGGIQSPSASLFSQGDTLHLRLTVRGDVYSVYLNGAATPATTLTTAGHHIGRIGLYDFTSGQQAFDNVRLNLPCMADIATEGSVQPLIDGPDGFVTGTDFDVFVQAFFQESRRPAPAGPYIADLTNGDGTGGPDGFITGSDFDFFVLRFFEGCAG
ncbi:MAG: hypothetical protein KIT68_03075 [Phycisphaeraceae bacterium]|nr:hypothetical protein [Phycisphaeraceae bacterium]